MLEIDLDTAMSGSSGASGDAQSGGRRPFAPAGTFERWLAAARPRLARLARLRGVAPDAIEDVVQETLLEAWAHQQRLRTPEGVGLWLDEICRNVCRRHARTAGREARHRMMPLTRDEDAGTGEDTAAALALLPDPTALDPAEALSRQEVGTLLDRALGSLAGQAREALELCYLAEVPQREAADRLGISLGALEARLHRARAQVRALLNGALRADAAALGLELDPAGSDGWSQTRLWCSVCGHQRLMGMFLPQTDGGTNLHMRCPACEERYGLVDVHSSNVHSKGLVDLTGLSAFRPAWKRTMRAVTGHITRSLAATEQGCISCGGPAAMRLLDINNPAKRGGDDDIFATTASLAHHPYRFWVWWHCPQCHAGSTAGDVFAASDLVYWADARTQRFMVDHPHWTGEPELLVEYGGQPAIRFQMADVTSAARLTVLAQRRTLRVLAVYG